jgi:hypothetical protein
MTEASLFTYGTKNVSTIKIQCTSGVRPPNRGRRRDGIIDKVATWLRRRIPPTDIVGLESEV